MLKRYWVVIFAFGLAYSGEALAQDAVPPSTDSPAVEQGSDGQAQKEEEAARRFPFLIRIVEDSENAERAKRRESDADQRERDDLSAQQSMAESTEMIVTISWWQLVLATAGTVLVFGSLFAAFWANWISRDTARRQLRAYIDVDAAKAEHFTGPSAPEHIRFMIILKNSGQTPARDVSGWVTCHFSAEFDTNFHKRVGDGGSRNPVGSGGELKFEFWTTDRGWPIEAVQAVRDRKTNLWVHGAVNYQDIFRRDWEVGFRFRVEPGKLKKPQMEVCTEGNYST